MSRISNFTIVPTSGISPINLNLLKINADPATTQMLSSSISFKTLDLSTTPNVYIQEGYLIVPKFLVTPVSGGISVTKKFVLLFNNTGYGLKFTLPQSNDNTMYITYCIADSTYIDGYQDYINTVDPGYVSAFVTWAQNYNAPVINTGGGGIPGGLGATRISIPIVGATSNLDLNFSAIGRVTSDLNTIKTFTVRISYYIDGSISGGQPPTTLTFTPIKGITNPPLR